MELLIDYKKSIDANASDYFSKSKKFRQKNEKIEQVLIDARKKLKLLEDSKIKDLQDDVKIKKIVKNKWHDKYRILITSNFNLIIMGMDATSNDILIKKHTLDDDYVFHTELAGSGYGVLNKNNFNIDVSEFIDETVVDFDIANSEILDEVCQFVAVFSKAGRSGISNPAVFWFKGSQMRQVSPEGIKLPRGSYYIEGKKNYVNYNNQTYGIGIYKNHFLWGTLPAFEKLNIDYVILKGGNQKPAQVAKDVVSAFKKLGVKDIHFDIDEIIKYIPLKKMAVDNYYIKRLENRKTKSK